MVDILNAASNYNTVLPLEYERRLAEFATSQQQRPVGMVGMVRETPHYPVEREPEGCRLLFEMFFDRTGFCERHTLLEPDGKVEVGCQVLSGDGILGSH